MSTTNVQPEHLSDAQVERLLIAIEGMKETNTIALLIATALEKQTSPVDRRRVLVTSFAQSFELMVIMNMAVNATVTPEEFKKTLAETRRLNHAANN